MGEINSKFVLKSFLGWETCLQNFPQNSKLKKFWGIGEMREKSLMLLDS
jgi:hypothetical protein